MRKLSISIFLFCLTIWFVTTAWAMDSEELLEPDEAFQFTATIKNADKLLLSWDIADGYYLYRQKFKLVSLTPGMKSGEPVFPAGQIKHDKFFGEVQIYRKHIEVELPIQRQDPKLNKLVLEVTYQGCADAGICYMPIQNTITFDLPAQLISGNKVVLQHD